MCRMGECDPAIERVAQALFAKLVESCDEHLSVRGDDPVTINGVVYLRVLARVAVDAVRADPLAAAEHVFVDATIAWIEGHGSFRAMHDACFDVKELRAVRSGRDVKV